MIAKFVTAQLEQLGRCIPDLLLVVDTDGIIAFSSRGRGGLSRAELLGRRLSSLYISTQAEAADVVFAEVLLSDAAPA